MSDHQTYNINTHIKFGSSTLIDVGAFAASVEPWFNQSLTEVNDCVVRLGVIEGEFHWHDHEAEDEFFFVLEGELLIDLEGETVTLGPHQGYTVPRTVRHRTRAPKRTVMLMIEAASIVPTGRG